MQLFDINTFSACLHQIFRVRVGESRVDMTLVNLEKLPVHVYPGMRREPFVLTFHSPLRTIFPEQTYVMENATLGTVAISIVPAGMDKDGITYSAVFN